MEVHEMGSVQNAVRVRHFYAAGPPDDDAQRHSFASPEISWHVPGDNPVSGSYHGYTAVFGEIAERMQPLDVWQIDVVEIMANTDFVVATVHLVAARGTARVETDGAHVFRFDADGRIVEVWGFTADQTGLDAVFRSPAAG
jgi:ketosteroid isomerase-like protein